MINDWFVFCLYMFIYAKHNKTSLELKLRRTISMLLHCFRDLSRVSRVPRISEIRGRQEGIVRAATKQVHLESARAVESRA